jgi:hypothetical protein
MFGAKPVTSPSEETGPLAPSEGQLQPGELKIKERRTWKTWQLLTAVLIAVIAGMWINGDTGGGTSTASGTTGNGKLPPPSAATGASSGGGGATTTTTAAGGSSATTTTVAGGSTTTTPAGGSTTTSTTSSTSSGAAAGPARVLLESPQQQGNWTSTAFTTTTAGWNIGWAFRCTPVPASGSSFQVFVTPAGSAPSGTPAISETGASGQSVTAQSSLGSQTLVVQAPATCIWIVKVTGS